jgi:type III pantothenate kinase
VNLVVDIGNTRLKWALARAGELVESGSRFHRERVGERLLDLSAAAARDVERVVVANVAGEAIAARVAGEAERRFGLATRFVAAEAHGHGLRSAYAEPSRLGVDRWVAMIAAHRLVEGAVCVLSVGTAATFDAVAADGRHLGGLILPGMRLMADALDRQTDRIGATEPAARRPEGLAVLGASTETAVGQGTVLAISAAFDRATTAVAASLGAVPTALLTGGDAHLIRPWLETPVQLRADLVLEGLALIADSGD